MVWIWCNCNEICLDLRSGFGSSCVVSSSSTLFPFSAVTSDVKSVSAMVRIHKEGFYRVKEPGRKNRFIEVSQNSGRKSTRCFFFAERKRKENSKGFPGIKFKLAGWCYTEIWFKVLFSLTSLHPT